MIRVKSEIFFKIYCPKPFRLNETHPTERVNLLHVDCDAHSVQLRVEFDPAHQLDRLVHHVGMYFLKTKVER